MKDKKSKQEPMRDKEPKQGPTKDQEEPEQGSIIDKE